MGYVYKITNKVNNKVYIGITKYKNPKNRFYKHIAEHTSSCNYSKRPLYEAMQKYGTDNFLFEVIEKVDNEKLGDRETYWIKFYNSFIGFKNSNGYNATLGGDGGHAQLTPEEISNIVTTYKSGKGMRYIVKNQHHAWRTIKICLESTGTKINSVTNCKKISQLDAQNNVINIFNSIVAANVYLGKPKNSSKIGDVCRGKRKSAYGYFWKYAD